MQAEQQQRRGNTSEEWPDNDQDIRHGRANGGRTGSEPLPSGHLAVRPKQPRQAYAATNGVSNGQTNERPRQPDQQMHVNQAGQDWRSQVRPFNEDSEIALMRLFLK